MPLSEHEQRLLEQMERALAAEDPKFASSLRHGSSGADRRRIGMGVVGLLLGLALLIAGVSTKIAVIGVVGFLVMLAATTMIVLAVQRPTGVAAQQPPAGPVSSAEPKGKPSGSGGFMNRLEDRWQRRNRGEGRN